MPNLFDVRVSFDNQTDIDRLGGQFTGTLVSAANETAAQGQARALFAQMFNLIGTMTVISTTDLGPTPPGFVPHGNQPAK